jgi:hypothetical protein
MNYNKTIDNKKIFTRPDGQQVVDLTQQNFNPKNDITIFEVVSVPKDFEMRPDLVAKTAYGNIDSTDLLLKQSGFSNPFTFEENDIIFYKCETSLVRVDEGMFAIFFPDDIHLPGIRVGETSLVKKVVVKVRV